MIIKKTELDQLEITKTLNLQLRFTFQVLEDAEILNLTYHRMNIEKDVNIREALSNLNLSFISMNKETLGAEDLNLIEKVAICIWSRHETLV